MDSHGADNGFHAGCAQQMEADSSLLEQVHTEMVDRCIAVHQYEALSVNVVQGDAGSVCQSVVFRQDCNQPVFCQWKEGMGFTVQHVAAGDDEVIGVVGKSLQQVVFLNFLQKNMDEGMAVCKILQHGCEMVLGQDGEGADGQPLACFFLEFADSKEGSAVFFGQVQGFLVEHVPCLCQDGGAPASVPQLDIQFLFQLHDLFGQGGLADVKCLRGVQKGVALDGRNKIIQLFKGHICHPFLSGTYERAYSDSCLFFICSGLLCEYIPIWKQLYHKMN